MKILMKAALIAALTLFAGTTFAQKFGHVNQREIVAAMPEIKAAQTTLESFGKELDAQLEEVQVEFNKKYEAYQKEEASLSSEMKTSKMKELQDMSARIEERRNAASTDYQKKQEELYTPILKKANDAITKVAKANNCIYVFDPSTLLYLDEAQSLDLTSQVKKELGM